METLNNNLHSECKNVLVLTAAVAPSADLTEAAARFGWPLLAVANSAEALRQVVLMGPAALVVSVDARQPLAATEVLIGDLRRRRPELPVIAMAHRHDDEVERGVRAAGVSAYVCGFSDGARDVVSASLAARPTLERALSPGVHSGCSPPAFRRRALVRSRGQPRLRSGVG